MVLTTGNKSEMSVGYATLYGDMNGGFNPDQGPLQDGGLSRCARWRNAHVPQGRARGRAAIVIPENILTKAPTAELRENQTDQDRCRPTRCWTTSWPAWSRTRCRSPTSSRAGIAPETVKKIERLLYSPNTSAGRRRPA